MLHSTSRGLLLLAVSLSLAACSSLSVEPKKIDYKSAGKLPPLEIPPDLTSPGRDERYVVPDVSPRGSATFSAYSTERSGKPASATQEVLPQIAKMRIERSGNQRWLVVAATPEDIWPTLKEFWQELGFIVDVELPEAGVMETDWAENRAKLPQDSIRAALGKFLDQIYSTPERDKFRTRLEKGAEPGTTEIYISHRGMYETFINERQDRTMWQPRPADPELEAEMLRRLMVRLGSDEERAKTLLASASASEERAKLIRPPSGAGSLQLFESFDRSWRRVGLALDRVGFTVEDRDRTKGIYFVRYVDPETGAKKSDGGFLSKLQFWDSGKPEAKQQYRIFVEGEGGDSTVRILTREGGQDNSETARKILGLLYEQLK